MRAWIGWLTIAIATSGIVLAVHHFGSPPPVDTYQRVVRIAWTIWVGTSLLGVVAGVRCVQRRPESKKLAVLWALLALVTAVAWIAIAWLAFTAHLASLESAWCVAANLVWSSMVLFFAWRSPLEPLAARETRSGERNKRG